MVDPLWSTVSPSYRSSVNPARSPIRHPSTETDRPIGRSDMVEKPPQPKPEPTTKDTRDSARDALQQSMDRRW